MISEQFRALWLPRLLSVVRIMTGLLFLQHGLTKYIGFPVPTPATFQVASLAGVAGAIEIVAGVLITIGLFSRTIAFIASGEMAFAYFISHAPRSVFPQANGGELAILFCFIFLYIALAGGGSWGVDAMRAKASTPAP